MLKNPTSKKEIFRRQNSRQFLRHVPSASLLDDSAGKRVPDSFGERIKNDQKQSKIMSPIKGLDTKTNGLTNRQS
jgi:hypothetical protein